MAFINIPGKDNSTTLSPDEFNYFVNKVNSLKLAILQGSGFVGSLRISDVPDIDGWYFASETGVYINAGNIEVQPVGRLNIIVVSNFATTFSLVTTPVAQSGDLNLQGTWNASTNTPNISISPNVAEFWITSVAGTITLGSETYFDKGDWAVFTVNGWTKVPAGVYFDETSLYQTLSVDGNTVSISNGNTISFPVGSDTQRTDEEIRDVASAQWINGANTTVVKDDALNTLKIDVSISKEQLGLENVDNTSDLDKPISTLTQEALTIHTLKLAPFTVAVDKVTIDRDLHVEGNITASEEVVAYVAGAISGDVLSLLSTSVPLRKSTNSNIVLDYNISQFEINSAGELQIASGVLAPASHNHLWADITDKPTTFAPALHSHAVSDITDLQTELNDKLETSLKGVANGLAELDAQGFVVNTQLPSYVDDVIEGTYVSSTEFNDLQTTPVAVTGEAGKIYIDTTSNKTYRWSGTVFAIISETIALGETSSTAYRGDRGKIAYDHSQTAHAPSDAQKNSDITKAEIEAKLTGAITTHTHAYLPLAGGTLTGDLTIGAKSRASDTKVKALSADGYSSGFEAYGSNQGTGYFYAGQSTTHGGGMFYNGDGTPVFASGETADKISFYRRTNSVNSVVFSYAHNSDTVDFAGAATFASSVTAAGGNSNEWNTAYDKSIPFTVTTGQVTIDRDLHVNGNITASEDVIAYVSGAVSGSVLSLLTASAPLYKSSDTNVALRINATQFEVNVGNELQIKAGVLAPAAHTHLWADITDKPTTFAPAIHTHDYLALAGGTLNGGGSNEVLKIAADANPYIRFVENGTNVGFLQFSSTGAYLSNQSNTALHIRTNNINRISITAGGSVSIGGTLGAANLSGTNTGDQDLSGYLLNTTDTFTGTHTGDTLHLGGSQITGSAAVLQVNGFQRTGNVYIHEGGNSPTGTGIPLGNNSGNLQWNGYNVWTSNNLTNNNQLSNGSSYLVDGSGGRTRIGQYALGSVSSGELEIRSDAATGWAPDDSLGRIRFYTTDTSGAGLRDLAKIEVLCETGNNSSTTTMSGAMVFSTSPFNGNIIETLRLGSDQSATFASSVSATDGLFSGNVGIGAANPTADSKLSIIEGNVGLEFSVDNAVASTARIFSYDRVAAAPRDLQLRGLKVNFVTGASASEALRLNSDQSATFASSVSATDGIFTGNVGIGTTSPGEKLTVSGNGRFSNGSEGTLTIKHNYGYLKPNWGIKLDGDTNTSGGYLSQYINIGGFALNQGGTYYGGGPHRTDANSTSYSSVVGVNGELSFYTNTSLASSTNFTPSERMRITASGNVGIGMTTGFNAVSGTETTLGIQNSNVASLYLDCTSTNGHKYLIYSAASGQLAFYDKTNETERMRITSTGNVGIGTTSPGVRLTTSTETPSDGPTLGSGTVGGQALLSLNGLYGQYSGVSNNGNVWHQVQRNDTNVAVYNMLLQPAGGNVGIGTTSPNALLDASSLEPRLRLTSTRTGVSSGQTAGAIDFYTSDGSSEGNAVNAKIEAYSTDIYGRLGLKFFTGGGGNPIESLIIDNSGNSTFYGRVTGADAVFSGTVEANMYNVKSGDGKGVRFWSSESYKISMGNSSVYHYGTVSGYSIKTQMDTGSTDRGFTWGRLNTVPIASLNATSGNFQTAGSIVAGGEITAYSDKRLKNVIRETPDVLDKLMQVNIVDYTRNDEDTERFRTGVIAQELREVFPQYVKGDEDKEMLSVNYAEMVSVCIKAIQELKEEIKQSKNK